MSEISVIVPVYKVEPYLRRCVDSILNQSYSDFELILVDDGSPDNCGSMCDEYASEDPRIVVIHQQNGGLSAARNSGMDWVDANSDSKWFAFVDSDDWIHRDYLKLLYTAALRYDTQLALCREHCTDTMLQDADLSSLQPECLPAERAYVQHYCPCMHAWGKLIHRDLMGKLRFPKGKLFEDSYITHNLVFRAQKVALCDAGMYYYFFSPDSITRKKWDPRKMDEFEGHWIRLDYLIHQGYPDAVKKEIREFFQAGLWQLEQLREVLPENPDYRQYDRQMCMHLRKLFSLGRNAGLFSLNGEHIRIRIMIASPRWVYPMLQKIKQLVWMK